MLLCNMLYGSWAENPGARVQQLSKIVGENLKRLRAEQALSLEALAKLSGVSKSRLGQIERGEANPSITTVWQIANALKVEFSALITSPQADSVVVSRDDLEPVTADEGRCRTYALFPYDPALGFETYLSEMAPGAELAADPHPDGTRETITVVSGELSVQVADETHTLRAGDAIRFTADVPHAYRNSGDQPAVYSMLVSYRRP